MIKKFKFVTRMNEDGFSLVSFILVAAVALVIVAGMAESIILMVRSQQSIEVSQDADMIFDQVQAILSNEQACTAALGTNLSLNSLTGSALEITAPLSLANTPVSFYQGANLTPRLELTTFGYIADPSGTPDVTFTEPGPPVVVTTRMVMLLRMQTRKITAGLFSPVSKPRDIKIHAIVNTASKNISACVAENDETKACEQMGGVWNPVGVTGKKCVPFRYCDWGGAYSIGPVAQGGFINQLTGGNTCPSGYNVHQSGAIASAQRVGKYKVQNNFQPIYSCLRCGGAIVTGGAPLTVLDSDLDSALTDLFDSQDVNRINADKVKATICTSTGNCSIP